MITINKLVFSKINYCIEKIKVYSHQPIIRKMKNIDYLDNLHIIVLHHNIQIVMVIWMILIVLFKNNNENKNIKLHKFNIFICNKINHLD